jgi:chaperonin GroEL
MLNKQLLYNNEARDKLLNGINTLANAVKTTLGPKGRLVIINNPNELPQVTKDGVTVAKSIQLKDQYENTGVMLAREASIQLVNKIGDSTTTTVVMMQSLVNGFDKAIKEGYHPIELKQSFEKLVKEVSQNLISDAKEITDKNIAEIATISANNDVELGKLIANAFIKVTQDGVIIVEESKNIETTCNVVNGMQFERGYLAPHFVTDQVKQQCVLENPFILITDQKINITREIIPILEEVHNTGRPLLIIAQDYDAEVLENMKLNHLQGILKCCLINCPSFGEYRKEVLEDIAVLTNGKVISYDSSQSLSDITIDQLGQCKKIIVDKEHTTIIEGQCDRLSLEKRVLRIKEELKTVDPNNTFMNEFLKLRLAKLTGGVCKIYVGGQTELEMKERKDRVDDSVCAVRAACDEGVVAGGGVNFLNAATCLSDGIVSKIVENALMSVFNQLCENAGIDPNISFKSMFTDNMRHINRGINFQTNCIVDMFEEGIINPAKADRLAWETAASIANLFLQTACVIVPEDDVPILIK